MIDFKYHIASLVAVFLALGIGILIGTTMLGNDTLIEYQKQVTDRLENQLAQLRQENESIQTTASELEMELNIQKEFNENIFPVLINERLEDVNLAVVETKGYSFSGDVISALEKSGANVSSITSFVDFSDQEKCRDFAEELGWDEESEIEYTTFILHQVAKAIVNENAEPLKVANNESALTEGESISMVEALSRTEIIQVSGNYNEPIQGIVLVGGSQEREAEQLKEISINLIKVFQNEEVPVYGVEGKSIGHSYMQFYQKQGLKATIDNADTVPGQLALILAIDGQPGHYGVKSTSQRLLPEI